jgi:2,4-dienoyl-CoA reductase-like NADH-dependent reductase (Old Yellow Enzyme family)
MMKEYYCQRASAGLVITEATGISKQGTARSLPSYFFCELIFV